MRQRYWRPNDGIDDLAITAPGANNIAGTSYIIGGSASLSNLGVLELAQLNASRGLVIHGASSYEASGISIDFIEDMNGDGRADVLIGAPRANSGSGATYLVYSSVPPAIINSTLSIYQGQILIIGPNNLSARSENAVPQMMQFTLTALANHAAFKITNASGVFAVNSFTQENINDQQVQFIHDGSQTAPQYMVQASINPFAYTLPQPLQVNLHCCPIISQKSLEIIQGRAVTLSENNLNATAIDYSYQSLQFTVSNVQHGSFFIK